MSVLLYWLGAKGYELAVRIAALWNRKARTAVRGRRGLLKKIHAAMRDERRPRIWMHCASLGEFEQGRPVLEALRASHAEHAAVVTFFSPSGYEVRKDWEGADYVFYLPFDGPARGRKLVAALRPALVVWVKYDFWYFILRALREAGVPAILIAAVFPENAILFRPWGTVHRRMAQCFRWIFTQDAASCTRLLTAGIAHASTARDPRFDRVSEAAKATVETDHASLFAASGFTLVAGSTWPADEAALAEALRALPQSVKLLLVPHEVDEAHLERIDQRFAESCIRWSRWDGQPLPRVLVVDRVGMLMNLYQYADVAYVGGGFGRAGVHNVLEPAAHGVPVIIGPEFGAYREAVEMVEQGAASVVKNSGELATAINQLVENSEARRRAGFAARQVVEDGTGATQTILSWIKTAGVLEQS